MSLQLQADLTLTSDIASQSASHEHEQQLDANDLPFNSPQPNSYQVNTKLKLEVNIKPIIKVNVCGSS